MKRSLDERTHKHTETLYISAITDAFLDQKEQEETRLGGDGGKIESMLSGVITRTVSKGYNEFAKICPSSHQIQIFIHMINHDVIKNVDH